MRKLACLLPAALLGFAFAQGATTGTAGTSTATGQQEGLLYPSQATLQAQCAAGVEAGRKQTADQFYYDGKLSDQILLVTPGGNAFNDCATAAYQGRPIPKAFRIDTLFVLVQHAFQDLRTVRNVTATLLFRDAAGDTLVKVTPTRNLYDLKQFTRPCGNESCKAAGSVRLYFLLPGIRRTDGTAELELDVNYQDGSPVEQFQLYPEVKRIGKP